MYDASTNQPVSGQLPLNATVYDTSSLTHPAGPTATGTVTYTFYESGTCTTGTVVGTPQVVTLNADGTVPNSSDQGPLTAADSPYAFEAVYSGDANYLGGSSDCEPLAVGKGLTSITTTVYDASNNLQVTGTLPLDATVYDTSTVSYSASPVPTGTVTYTFFSSGDCTTGTVVGTPQVVTLNADGTVPNSSNQGPLTAADSPYAFMAVYSGDANYNGGASDCEPFSVGKGESSLGTTVMDASTNEPVIGQLPLDATVYDTAALTHAAGPTPTGTVTYTFFSSGDCTTGTVVGTPQVVTLNADGTVPNSSDHGPLMAADSPYAFMATYSGDGNYFGASSACEPFSVAKGTAGITTTVYDASTSQPVSGQLPLNATVYDTSSLTHPASPVPTGTVTYTFFSSGDCTTGTVVGTPQVVTLNADGTVPNSSNEGPLTAADSPYAFMASYSGDANYHGAESSCEPFAVARSITSIKTVLSAASVQVNVPVRDSATLQGQSADAGGTVTYSVYSDRTCRTLVKSVGAVTVVTGRVPDSASFSLTTSGTYYVRAAYSGDRNNTSAVSACESEVLKVTGVPIGPPQTGIAQIGRGIAGHIILGVSLLLGGLLAVLLAVGLRRRRAALR